MFNFGGITHVITNPSGHAPGYNFSLVGSVPVCMMQLRDATQSDVMGGRAFKDNSGKLYSYAGRKWETVAEILEVARENDVKMCTSVNCACRKLF